MQRVRPLGLSEPGRDEEIIVHPVAPDGAFTAKVLRVHDNVVRISARIHAEAVGHATAGIKGPGGTARRSPTDGHRGGGLGNGRIDRTGERHGEPLELVGNRVGADPHQDHFVVVPGLKVSVTHLEV